MKILPPPCTELMNLGNVQHFSYQTGLIMQTGTRLLGIMAWTEGLVCLVLEGG